MKHSNMKKQLAADPLDEEIDFTNARPNPYARDYYKSRNLPVLAPDLVDVFPDSESVNEALRTLVRLTAEVPRRVSAKAVAAPKSPRKKAHS
jgi:hypothetical protein